MSVDLRPEAITPEVQAFLDAFDRLSDEAKRDALTRLSRRSSESPEARSTSKGDEDVDVDDLDWGEITEEDHDRLAAEAFAEIDRQEEEFARGRRRQSG